MDELDALWAFLVAALIAFAITPPVARLARRLGVIHQPRDRDLHQRSRRNATERDLRRRAAAAVQRERVLTGTGCSVANPYNNASRSRHSRNRREK